MQYARIQNQASNRPFSLRCASSSSQPDAAAASGDSSFSKEICCYKLSLLNIPGAVAEDLGDLLLAEGATSVSVEEYRPEGAPEEKIFANDPSDPQGLKRVWELCSVIGYFPSDFQHADAVAVEALAALGLPSSPDQRTLEPVRAQDWEAAIKDSYQPVEVAEGLWIVPTWSERATLARNAITNKEEEDSSVVNLILEPGLAFGTGDHPTTRLCLKWLQALHIRNTSGTGENSTVRVMDYGTGSGVLAVAALLLGATTAIGTDVEHLAVRSAAQNAALNNVGDRFTALQCGADLNAPEPMGENGYPAEERVFDIVVANILRGPLVELAPRLAAYATSPGAVLGLSGILETQAPEVIEAYSPWFDDFEVKTEESWALITAKRK